MSDRTDHGVDSQIDRALRAIVDHGRTVDLHARVLSAIDAGGRFRGRAGHGRWPAFLGVPGFRRLAFRVALAAVLGVAVFVLWSAVRPAPPPLGSARGGTTQPAPVSPAYPAPGGSRALNPTAAAMLAIDGREVVSPVRKAMTHRRRAMRPAESWNGGLPPLEAPAPIELEPIGEPHMRVAHLEVERLSIAPLEMDALDGSEEE
jgi:hypothetical protein